MCLVILGVVLMGTCNAEGKTYGLVVIDNGVPVPDCLVHISTVRGKALFWEEEYEYQSLFTNGDGQVSFAVKGRRISISVIYDLKVFKVFDGRPRDLKGLKLPVDIGKIQPYALLNDIDLKYDARFYSDKALKWLKTQRDQAGFLLISVKYPDGTPASHILYRVFSHRRGGLFVEHHTSQAGFVGIFVPKNDTFDVQILPKETKHPEVGSIRDAKALRSFENVQLEDLKPGSESKPISNVVLEPCA